MYAIIETGGKQYRVSEGRSIKVEKLGVAEGETIELDRVLMIGDGADVTVGNPVIEGAKVVATAQENGRDKKIIVFKYKHKIRYRRKNGHRQEFTSLKIEKILGAGEAAPKAPRRKKKAEIEAEETVENGA